MSIGARCGCAGPAIEQILTQLGWPARAFEPIACCATGQRLGAAGAGARRKWRPHDAENLARWIDGARSLGLLGGGAH